jgi:hypothetical protein
VTIATTTEGTHAQVASPNDTALGQSPLCLDSVAKLWLRLRLDRDSVDQHCDSQGAVDDGAARARTGSILLQV